MTDRLLLSTDRGFTLIELMVVLALVALLLTVTVPRLADNPFSDDKRTASMWIASKTQVLRRQSLSQARDHALHIDMETGHLWTTHAAMRPEEFVTARQGGYVLPAGTLIKSVEFPNADLQTSGQAEILFYKKGYAQKAMILAEFEDGSHRSFLIEPFLPRVKIYEEPVRINQ